MQDKNQLFLDLLQAAEMTQADLSRTFSITTAAISRWHKIGVPKYAAAYLKLHAENIRLRKQIDEMQKAHKACFSCALIPIDHFLPSIDLNCTTAQKV
ncbi:hypothetical protein LVJ83_12675 [Uruburuella testudinis]|uniref:YdaS antitoxin of YdaST toxin-antitoxin system n=1 Tax=Uruburuella testudinis TaxID=1282863 RepID=A0ABY4DST3_9NEIS|nr:hypothetical protein [Uruburuella testudinis]UOO81750.1 hypothetical protein LVJ83_12675 [Uruburuella testudinis]